MNPTRVFVCGQRSARPFAHHGMARADRGNSASTSRARHRLQPAAQTAPAKTRHHARGACLAGQPLPTSRTAADTLLNRFQRQTLPPQVFLIFVQHGQAVKDTTKRPVPLHLQRRPRLGFALDPHGAAWGPRRHCLRTIRLIRRRVGAVFIRRVTLSVLWDTSRDLGVHRPRLELVSVTVGGAPVSLKSSTG